MSLFFFCKIGNGGRKFREPLYAHEVDMITWTHVFFFKKRLLILRQDSFFFVVYLSSLVLAQVKEMG